MPIQSTLWAKMQLTSFRFLDLDHRNEAGTVVQRDAHGEIYLYIHLLTLLCVDNPDDSVHGQNFAADNWNVIVAGAKC
jgi:hypothetical protein